uniref:Uncharacterized protein n=1 Tax=Heliothis virescens TaxID=7102 RepID=A0A2A4K7I7_HELVI
MRVCRMWDKNIGVRAKKATARQGRARGSALGVSAGTGAAALHHSFPYHDPPMLFECNQTCGCNLLLPLPHADTRAADHYMFALDVKPDLLEVGTVNTQKSLNTYFQIFEQRSVSI